MNSLHLVRFLAAGLCAAALQLPAAPVRVGPVEVDLVAENTSMVAGQPFAVALRIRMDDHWHTYWQNSGDAGLATTINWALPPGFTAGDIQWPVPKKLVTGPVVSYGYEGEVLLISTITPPTETAPGAPVVLNAKVDWLMCREECIPGDAQLTLTLPVTRGPAAPDAGTAAAFARARQQQPVDGANWSARFSSNDNVITLVVEPPAGTSIDPTGVYFYPSTLEAIAPAGAQTATFEDGRLVIQLAKSEYATGLPATISGVLTAPGGFPPDLRNRGVAITATAGAAIETTAGATPISFLGLLLPALLGGLILNLMPCVFPVLGVKILGFVNQAGADRRKVTLHGLVFTAGVLASFWVLAGALIALRAGGAQLGWGFQLQSPAFVFGLAVFLLAFALNLSGVFEFGLSATGVGGSLQMQSGYTGSFFTGVLATVVSTPCAAPFLAPALGAALALPALPSLTLFTVIAVGLSLPYLFLSAFPQFIKMLPRPGAWMETFKQFMAFPLYATVAFLVWVLAGQVTNEDTFLNVLAGFVLVALGLWGYGKWTQNGARGGRRVFGFAFAALGLAGGLWLGYPQEKEDPWQEWRPGLAETLQTEGKVVYVDFTARWCMTCKANKLAVFSSAEVNRELAKHKVVLLRADWTNRDPEITRTLATFGRSAVPFNLIYAPGLAEPISLPPALTPGIVLAALGEATAAR